MLSPKINPNGPDIVPAKFIKETAIECGAMSHHLLHQLYQHGTSNCTHALACPIYRRGKKSEPVNYKTVTNSVNTKTLVKLTWSRYKDYYFEDRYNPFLI